MSSSEKSQPLTLPCLTSCGANNSTVASSKSESNICMKQDKCGGNRTGSNCALKDCPFASYPHKHNDTHLNNHHKVDYSSSIRSGGSNNSKLSYSSEQGRGVSSNPPVLVDNKVSPHCVSSSPCVDNFDGVHDEDVESPTSNNNNISHHNNNNINDGLKSYSGGNRSPLKISDNHLSTKLARNKSSPYFKPNNLTRVCNGVKTSSQSGCTGDFIDSCVTRKDIDDKDTVMSLDEQESKPSNNNNNLVRNNNIVVGNRKMVMRRESMDAREALVCGSSATGVSDNPIFLAEDPDQSYCPNAINHSEFLVDMASQNGSCDLSRPEKTHKINNSINELSNNQLHCNGLLNTTSCNGGTGGFSNCDSNGSSIIGPGSARSMPSPSGSFNENDCDELKVINGDSDPNDLPDPDAIKMFVGQIPKQLNEDDLRTIFEKYGRVFQINVLRDKSSKQSKGCCFVTFYTRKAALEAQNALHNVKTLPGMNHPIQMKPADNENRYERKLFIGMLSRKCSESDVRNMFAKFGIIDECTVLRDANGQSKGCAFVTFASKQSAQNAIKNVHHSITMEGCSSPIVVKFADTQKDKDQKRQQQVYSSFVNNLGMTPVQLSTIQQLQQQQQQSASLLAQYGPAGMQGLPSTGSIIGSANGTGIPALSPTHSLNQTNLGDYAALATTLFNLSGLPSTTNNQNPLAVTALTGLTPAPLSPPEVNGRTLIPASSLTNLTGNGISSIGLLPSLPTTYTSAVRPALSSKQVRSKLMNGKVEGPDGSNLFIYHLPADFQDGDLASMFANFGTVLSAKVFIDKHTNLSKCFGFVSYDNPYSAQMAIQTMNGFQVGMKRLKVQLKRAKDAAKPY